MVRCIRVPMCRMTNPRVRNVAVVVVAVGAIAAFALYRPDKLFIDQTSTDSIDAETAELLAATTTLPVSQAPPTDQPSPAPTSSTQPSGPTLVSKGEFESVEHDTTGTAAIITKDGNSRLVLSGFKTSNGPDLKVLLSKSADNGSQDYDANGVILAPLKGNTGDQVYELGTAIASTDVQRVIIWCERFSVAFGVARLNT